MGAGQMGVGKESLGNRTQQPLLGTRIRTANTRRDDMSCERCGGLMVTESICELMEAGSRRGIDTTRCLNCGNFEDTIIRTNRDISRVPRQPAPHTVGTCRQSAVQPCVVEEAIQTDGVIPKYLRGRAPRLPVGAPSAETETLEPSRIELGHSP